jgi:hypothetical protein
MSSFVFYFYDTMASLMFSYKVTFNKKAFSEVRKLGGSRASIRTICEGGSK